MSAAQRAGRARAQADPGSGVGSANRRSGDGRATPKPAVRFEPQPDGLAHLVLDRPDDAVNAIDLGLMDDLEAALEQAAAARPEGLILWSAKPDQFIGGADLKLILQAPSGQEIAQAARRLQQLLDRLEALPFPAVAAIGGAALGGGLEVALACDWRVGADSPALTLGLPEVTLGLIPAGGGTQRLPRLVGLRRALILILTGRRLNARQARKQGLLDLLVHPAALRTGAAALARRGKREPAPRSRLDRGLARLAPARRVVLDQARKRTLEETRGHYPAPLKAIDCIETGLARGMKAGLEAEARAFGELASTQTAHSLIHLMLEGLRLRKERPAGRPRPVHRVGVVGAGFMGSGIAEVAAVAGYRVRVRDVDHQAVGRGLASATRLIRDAGRKGVFDRRQAQEAIGRLSGTVDYSGFQRAEVAIEAVFEDLEVKRQVVGELEEVLGEEAVIGSNTSALPIHQIASGARHPERILGLHFFSPVHRMPLLEVVRWEGLAEWALATGVEVGRRLGKTVIVVGDGPGFYTTRTLGVMVNEAGLLLEDGARVEDVDRAMTGFGFPVGPFVLVDELGPEVAARAGATLAAAFGEGLPGSRAIPALVEAGHKGRKGGSGFYLYDGKRKEANPGVYELLGTEPHEVAPETIQERLALAFVNEAARCLEEGVLGAPADGDIGAVLGVGFPPFLGGPFRYADSLGPAQVRRRLEELAGRLGPRYEPSSLFQEGEPFYP